MKAAIYDPQLLTRKGVQNILELHSNIQSTSVLDCTKNIEEQLVATQPDLLVLEYLGQPNIQATALNRVRTKFSTMKTLIITGDNDPLSIREFTNLGVEGFLNKTCSSQEVDLAITMLSQGSKFFCTHVMELITQTELTSLSELSDREMQVIRYVGKGHSSEEIADQLHVSIHTVNSHRKNILKKLGLKSPTELVVYALKKGWVSLHD